MREDGSYIMIDFYRQHIKRLNLGSKFESEGIIDAKSVEKGFVCV